jgi:hypothetical protein
VTRAEAGRTQFSDRDPFRSFGHLHRGARVERFFAQITGGGERAPAGLIRLSRENAEPVERERPRRERRGAEEPVAEVEVVEARLEAEPTDPVRPPDGPRPPA